MHIPQDTLYALLQSAVATELAESAKASGEIAQRHGFLLDPNTNTSF